MYTCVCIVNFCHETKLVFILYALFCRVCYDRVKFSPTLLTFGLSAWWHGFYPGYAFVFVYFAIQTNASRKVSSQPHTPCALY